MWWASDSYSMGEVTSTAGLTVVQVCIEADQTRVSIFLLEVVSFAGLVFERGYGVGLFSHGFLGFAIV